MNTINALAPRFVEEVPEALDLGVLYVSLEHGSMIHLCACGCGHEVVLPLTPLDWSFNYDGVTISVSPSVGSWSLPCRSHYIIDHGRVRWARDWSDEQIDAGRYRDQSMKDARYGRRPVAESTPKPAEAYVSERRVYAVRTKGMLVRVGAWLAGLRRE